MICRTPCRSCCVYLAIKYPGGWNHKRDVGRHVDHTGPVDGERADAVVAHHDVCDDGELQPVHRIGRGAEHKDEQHQPSPSVLLAIWLLLHGRGSPYQQSKFIVRLLVVMCYLFLKLHLSFRRKQLVMRKS